MFTTRSQLLLQQQQERNNNNNSTPLLPPSRWLARKVHTGVIYPLHNGEATISGDPQEEGSIAVRTDTADGKRLSHVAKLRVHPSASSSSAEHPTSSSRTLTTHLSSTYHPSATLATTFETSGAAGPFNSSSSSSAVTAICALPRDRTSAPGEVWVAWSSGKIAILNEPANKVLTVLPSVAATSGAIVAMIPFYSGSVSHQLNAHSTAFNRVCDGGWLFGRRNNAGSGRGAVMLVTASGALLVIDVRSRSLMFRVPPSHNNNNNSSRKNPLVKCACALSDDTKALILLATEDCVIQAVELKIVNNNNGENISNPGSRATTPQRRMTSSSLSSAPAVCVPKLVQTLNIAPPPNVIQNVDFDCCPMTMSSSTTYLRDPTPTVFVGFLSGHACFFKIIFTGAGSFGPGNGPSTSRNGKNNTIFAQQDDSDSYMLLFNQTNGMTQAHELREAVVAVVPIFHNGNGCISVTKSGACVWSIDQKIISTNNNNNIAATKNSKSLSPSSRRFIGWRAIQRVENNFDPEYSYPIGATALSSNEVVLLLSDGGLRRLLVANPDPLDEENSPAAQNRDRFVSPRRAFTSARKKKIVTVLVKKFDPVSGQEYDVEEEVEVAAEDTVGVAASAKSNNLKSQGDDDVDEGISRGNRNAKTLFGSKMSKRSGISQNRGYDEEEILDDDRDDDDDQDGEEQRAENTNNEDDFMPVLPNKSSLLNAAEQRKRGEYLKSSSPSRTKNANDQLSPGHGFWGTSSSPSRLRNSKFNTSNNNSKMSSQQQQQQQQQQQKDHQLLKFKSSSQFVDRAMMVADSIRKLYSSEEISRQIVFAEQDNELGFLWHLHRSGLFGRDFLKSQESSMKSVFALQTEERESRMKFIVTEFFTSMTILTITQNSQRRKIELYLREVEERRKLFKEEDEQYHFMFYLMMMSPTANSHFRNSNNNNNNSNNLLGRNGNLMMLSSSGDPGSPSNFVISGDLEKQITREKMKSEMIFRENSALSETIQTLQTLLREEQQRSEKLRREIATVTSIAEKTELQREMLQMAMNSPSSVGRTNELVAFEVENNNRRLNDEIDRLHEILAKTEKQLFEERQIHELELSELEKQAAVASTRNQQQSTHDRQHHHRRSGTDLVDPIRSSFTSRSVSPRSTSNDSDSLLLLGHPPGTVISPRHPHQDNRRSSTQLNYHHHQHAPTDLVSPPSGARSPTSRINPAAPLLSPNSYQQQIHLLRRSFEDEQIKRGDAERSLEIISARLSKLTSILANSEKESQEYKLRSETAGERLRLTESELNQLKFAFAETSKRAERFEGLATKFEGEFALRDKELNKAVRERDLSLQTSDEAITAVEEQHRTIKHLTQSLEALRRWARKLLTLCDIAVSVGSEPPAMSSLRKFLREVLMDCATLKKFGTSQQQQQLTSTSSNHNVPMGIPVTALERICSIYDRTSLIQDSLFSPSNPSMVVLDKSEALEIMTKLRDALENAG